MRLVAVLYLFACLSLGLVSLAEARGIGSPGMGPPGPAGERGEVGAKGPQGERGSAGVPGTQGAKGDKGNDGPQGPKGDAGAPGAAGANGSPGAAGERGPAGPAGPAGAKGDAGAQGSTGAQGLKGDTGAVGAPKRVERYTATASASGVASFTWAACASSPDVDVIPTWSGEQMVAGGELTKTLSGATFAVKRSRGTLVASGGPFETAPAGTPLTVRVICN